MKRQAGPAGGLTALTIGTGGGGGETVAIRGGVLGAAVASCRALARIGHPMATRTSFCTENCTQVDG